MQFVVVCRRTNYKEETSQVDSCLPGFGAGAALVDGLGLMTLDRFFGLGAGGGRTFAGVDNRDWSA